MFDIFGHRVVSRSTATFNPKDEVIIITLGPFNLKTGYIVEYSGHDMYLVRMPDFGQNLTFHRSELIGASA